MKKLLVHFNIFGLSIFLITLVVFISNNVIDFRLSAISLLVVYFIFHLSTVFLIRKTGIYGRLQKTNLLLLVLNLGIFLFASFWIVKIIQP